ncbi:MAG TPA: MBL fold metallo-hydrolase [Amaricoccus sp.]|uniref:MBL fold metallo-hydrolase n=1 Tax=Amaricoccus sp. TaxID=1872485 RepID=UPI001D3E31F0|nr:MBL fold metallo-hydrolase [Amaricoccus sp.]MCB1373138.1 MBL fold metallo-hydrolase [Paracoccaceae bacterium]MCB1401436.1 MBL fold metallo-hydrolase [Paracoccaceae bacterium]HPG21157.1 MBL fold metallo-hydrolase [Amaricoccus sp.]HRW14638.1 MBL fold metallo-hydrolase [Amaricoccus sp.]
MGEPPFDRDHAPAYGVVERLAPGLRVVTARNPGPMTFTGTRSYILGSGEVAVIDPGPADPAHLRALEAALAPGERVRAVLVSHSHRDHSAGAAAFASRVKAPVLAHGDAAGVRSAAMARLAAAGILGGGEGVDGDFRPDVRLGEGERVAGPGWTLTALHTPGHLGDHLCFAWAEGDAIFSGDMVMGWATTMISPPDGDLADFRASVARLQARGEAVYYPGHGKPVTDPRRLLAWLLAHRAEREAEILARLAAGPATVAELTAAIYAAVDRVMWPAAGRNVLAHLVDLAGRGLVRPEGRLSAEARFGLV